MGLAKRTAHATTATVSAIADTHSNSALTGVPANYFEHRAEQLEEAVARLDAEESAYRAKLEAEEAAFAAKLAAQQAEFDARQEAVQADFTAKLEAERAELEARAAEFHHQAERYDANKCRCTYADCIMGRASAPAERAGKLLFQALMIGGMVSIMATFNGYRHSGLEFFLNYHWMYPLIFCLTFLVREAFANRITDTVIADYIVPRFQSIKRNALITLLNVTIMVPLMATIVTILLYGFDNLPMTLLEQVPITYVVALFVNFFVVSPIVKIFYNNVIVANTAEGETGFFAKVQETTLPFMAFFNV